MSKPRREDQTELYSQYIKTLFHSIKIKGIKTKLLAQSWLKVCAEDKDAAVMMIVSMILNACGTNLEAAEILGRMESKSKFFQYLIEKANEIEDFPLKDLIKAQRIGVFQDFFKNLVKESVENPDEITEALNWLVSLSSISLRSYRLASTIASLAMFIALLEQHSALSAQLVAISGMISNTQSSSTRSKNLKSEENDVKSRIGTIESQSMKIFTSVLSVRYQDIMHDIRICCIDTMAKALVHGPCEITTGLLEKTTFDRKNEVRLKALKSLSHNKQLSIVLKSRILEMCYDIDDKCCAVAIEICKDLEFPMKREEEIGIIRLAWVESTEIRKSVFEFLVEREFKGKLPVGSSESIGLGLEQGKLVSVEKALLQLVEFFKEFGGMMFRTKLFVEGLWAKTSAMRACDVMCELIMRGSDIKKSGTKLPEADRIILANFIVSVLGYLNTPKMKDKSVNTSAGIIQKIPMMLMAFKKDEATLRELVKIPNVLNLNCLASNDLKESFLAMIDNLRNIFFHSQDYQIIKAAAQALDKFSSELHPLKKEAKNEMAKIVEEVTSADPRTCIKQLSILMQLRNLTDDVNKIFSYDMDLYLRDYPEEIITLCFYWHLWMLNKVFKSGVVENDYLFIREKALKCFYLILDAKEFDHHRLTACRYLCETLYLIAGPKAAASSELYYKIPEELWTAIENYMIYSNLPVNESEDIDEAEEICIVISRILNNCQQLTNSHLCSSFIAFYGRSTIKRISVIVKQLLNQFKIKDENNEGAFSDTSLYFSIVLQSLIKVLCKGTNDNLKEMSELLKKILPFLPNDAKNARKSGRFFTFVQELTDFSFTDPANFGLLESLTQIVTKSAFSASELTEIYEHVKYYSDNFPSNREPLLSVKAYLKKLAMTDTKESESEKSQSSAFKRPKVFKAQKSSRERRTRQMKENPEQSPAKRSKVRPRDLIAKESPEGPAGRTRKSVLKRKTK